MTHGILNELRTRQAPTQQTTRRKINELWTESLWTASRFIERLLTSRRGASPSSEVLQKSNQINLWFVMKN